MSYERHDKISYTGAGPYGAVAKVGDTKFLDSKHDATTGTDGYYIEPIVIGDVTMHVTSKNPARAVVKSDENPDGKRYIGPFVIVFESQIKHYHGNHAAIEKPLAKEVKD